MRLGFIGAGKLGLPVALACESKGHDVVVTDINSQVADILRTRQLPYMEAGAPELLRETKIRFASLEEVVRHAEIIFVPIQTPHQPLFEGITPLPMERADFDYGYLKGGVQAVSEEIERQGQDKIVIIISTVLPGTIEREIKPILGKHVKLCYNPFFIAMTTTIHDFLNPEFVLFGVDDKDAVAKAEEFYRTITDAPFCEMTIGEAELTKMAYNTYIGLKIVFANHLMEICHKMGLNSDVVANALKHATDRLISPKYLSGGMGDGGHCHPRDNIALSYLAKNLNLSFDLSEAVMVAREKQTKWLADLVFHYWSEEVARKNRVLPVVILGKAYKPGTNLTGGSPALLLKHMLEQDGMRVIAYDPYIDGETSILPNTAALYFIGTAHEEFRHFHFPEDSIVIDPWRFIENHRTDIKVIKIGAGTQ